jgi:hypothetical protein
MIENSFDENITNNITPCVVKTVPECIKIKHKKKVLKMFSYEDYKDTNFCIKKYTLPILKQVCKENKLPVTGNKPVLLSRITSLFDSFSSIIIIQRIVRGWIIRHMNTLRGPAINNRTICINNTDPCSLEPIADIEYEHFYSYIDHSKKIYGFNILGLIHLLNTAKKIYNPYTRDVFTTKQTSSIIYLYNMTIYKNIGGLKENSEIYIRPNTRPTQRRIYSTGGNPRDRMNQFVNRATTLLTHSHTSNTSSYNNYNPVVLPSNITTEEMGRQYQQLVELRLKPLEERVRSMFVEIDLLGNYTNYEWFNDLDHLKYARLYRAIFDIWNYQGQLSSLVKTDICQFHGPFDGIFNVSVRHIDLTVMELKTICVIAFENLIYSGRTDEHRKLGALHALTALTIVSRSAQRTMPWLYESVLF